MRKVPLSLLIALSAAGLGAGPLDPPALPMPTQTAVEPRIPIGPSTTPGDADSVYRIDEPGSYYLTGNVTGANGKIGIELAASDVSIDLMGFEVVGALGAQWGIGPTGSGVENVTVRNGTVRGWGNSGIELTLAEGGLIENILAAENNETGISAGDHSIVRDCVAQQNELEGFRLNDGTSAVRCVAEGNNSGISIGIGGRATECEAIGNEAGGFVLNHDSQAIRCTASGNGTGGYLVGNGAMLIDSVANSNGTNGVEVTGDGSVVRNTLCRDNGDGSAGAGVHLATTADGCRVDGNTVTDNAFGVQVEGIHNMIVRNTATGNGTDYSIDTNNTIGQIIDFSADGQHVLTPVNAGAWDNIRH